MRKISYKGTYLSEDIVSKCFKAESHTLVDKVKTGNGFTTAYLKLNPKEVYQSNIIIVPNRQVILSKQEKSENDEIGFFLGGENSDRFELGRYKTMMFVADSFLAYLNTLKANARFIDKILIDEVHSILIQSSFRANLKDFVELVVDSFKEKAIVSVTATPMLFQKVDVQLISENLHDRTINITSNESFIFDKIKEDLKADKKVILATQDAKKLKYLLSNGELKANLKVGVSMYRKIVESFKVDEVGTDHNLTIISSAGFEGFDVDNGINNIYILEDRSAKWQSFFIQNIIQIIGRSRKGVDAIFWCRLENGNVKKLMDKDAMIKKANSKKISFEKKMTDKNYRFIQEYFDSKADETFGLIKELTLNENKYNLAKEFNDADTIGLEKLYGNYLTDRGYKISFLNNATNRLKANNVSNKIALKNIELNKDLIEEKGLFDDLLLPLYSKDSIKGYHKEFLVYLRRKYWKFEQKHLWNWSDEELKDFSDVTDNEFQNEVLVYRYLTNEVFSSELMISVFTATKKKKQEELGRLSAEYRDWIEKESISFQDTFTRLLMALSQDEIKMPKKIRNSRDYNMVTEVSMTTLMEVANLFNKDVFEVDIKNCNARILYALANVPFNENLYGENKKNKKAINKLLNKISSEFRGKRKTSQYKADLVSWLKSYNFDAVVIDYIIESFFDKSKDAIFNSCAYHEKQIIDSLQSQLIGLKKNEDARFIRRHDSIITFHELNFEQKQAINEFEYLGFGGWFQGFNLGVFVDLDLLTSMDELSGLIQQERTEYALF